MTPREQLLRGLAAQNLDLGVEAEDKLLAYAALLQKWNKVHNLTALREESLIVSHHLLDSLSVLPFLAKSKSLADIGSGGGLPGIPLAIVRPGLPITLVESSSKKAAFLLQAKIELKLANVSVQGVRVESLKADKSCDLFDSVTSRAFSSLADFVRLAGHLVAQGGALFAMKGVLPQEEIDQLPAGWRVRETHPLAVAGLDAQRHLIIVERA